MASIDERKSTIFETLPWTASAVAGGTDVTFTSGCAVVLVKPSGGAITVKVNDSTAAFSIADGYWSPPIMFNCDGENTNEITLTGATITCTGVSYHIPGVGPTPAVS
jgi:hypothetical protein